MPSRPCSPPLTNDGSALSTLAAVVMLDGLEASAGRLASTIPSVGTMHLRTGAAVVATFSYPEADGGWRITYERLTFPDLTGDRERDVWRITAETTALLETRIRLRPELWLWMHRRWKTPPPAHGIESVSPTAST